MAFYKNKREAIKGAKGACVSVLINGAFCLITFVFAFGIGGKAGSKLIPFAMFTTGLALYSGSRMESIMNKYDLTFDDFDR